MDCEGKGVAYKIELLANTVNGPGDTARRTQRLDRDMRS